MGFPMGCSELLFPRLLLQMAFVLDSVRQLIHRCLAVLGFTHLLAEASSETDHLPFMTPSSSTYSCEFKSISAVLIQELLPVVRYRDLTRCSGNSEDCAVCLCDMETSDEVRRLSNCRHVFHKDCLDRWVEHDQRTCPLCRLPLVPDDLRDDFNDRLWATAALPDSYYYSEHSSPSMMSFS